MKLAEWQAILAAYGVLLIGVEAGAGSLAVIAAWGIAVVYLWDTLAGGGSVLSGLFPGNSPNPAAGALFPGSTGITAPLG